MTYFEGHDVAPTPTADDADFWAHCADRRLMFQRCADCATVTHPPIGVCPQCQSLRRAWVEAPAAARVYSCTWVHTAAHESVQRPLPYNVVVVEFPLLPGVRLISNVIDAQHETLRIGAPVTLVWEAIDDGFVLPRFRLVASEEKTPWTPSRPI